jgi:hypothetical protein
MEQKRANPPFIRFDERPGEPFDILQVNVPVPRAIMASPAAEHLGAAGRELALAFQAVVEQLRKAPRAHEITAPPPPQHVEIPMAGPTQ